MSLYIRLSCEVLTDPKILKAGPTASMVWIKGLLWSKQHLTDGFIPDSVIDFLCFDSTFEGSINDRLTTRQRHRNDMLTTQRRSSIVTKLVESGLWKQAEGGYTVGAERWARWQTTSAEVKQKKEDARLRKQRSRGKLLPRSQQELSNVTTMSRVTMSRGHTEPRGSGSVSITKLLDSNKLLETMCVSDETSDDLPKPVKKALSKLESSWNEICTNLAKVEASTNGRMKSERVRLKEHSLVWWISVFQKINASKFCCGGGSKKWWASFDWVISNDTNGQKVLEGKYDVQVESSLFSEKRGVVV